jgi:hypothetical protein
VLEGSQRILADVVVSDIHSGKKFEAAEHINDFCELSFKLKREDENKWSPLLHHWLHWLLNNGHPDEAARILWTPTQFTSEPESVKQIWEFFEQTSMGLIMSGASLGKSYSMGARLLLEFIRDPEYTAIKVIGPNEDHLEANLFSHLVNLHKSASLQLPGEVGELFIGVNRRDQSASIKGIIIPVGKVKKAGRLQGVKRRPRPEPHPIFGDLSRLFIFVDEFENVPAGVWSDCDNILSQVSEETQGFKLVGAYNPTNQHDEVAKRAEPPFGWENFDVNSHYRWKSKRGWDILRLDGERCENVKQGKVIFRGLQTKEGLEAIARNAGGKASAGYLSQGRGAYPPQGLELTVVPAGMLPKMRGEFIWIDAPDPVSSADLALEGGDAAPYTLGKWGRASGMKLPPSIDFPNGRTIMFKDRNGHAQVRYGLQADQQFPIPKGETVAMKTRIIEINKKAGVRGHLFACDRTGHGAGIADLIKYEWSPQIHDVNYSEACSKTKIMLEDTKTCNEEFERINSELWFAFRKWGEFGILLINPQFDLNTIAGQLTDRRFRTTGGKSRVEPKTDYMDRHQGQSPNEADSLTLFVHAARMGMNYIPSMKDDSINLPGALIDGDDDWPVYPGGVRLDATSKSDYLDERDLQIQ